MMPTALPKEGRKLALVVFGGIHILGRHRNIKLLTADLTKYRACQNHGEEAAEQTQRNDQTQIHTQNISHQHRAGRGRNEGVAYSQTGQKRNDEEQGGFLCPPGNGESQGDEDDQACVKEYRDGDHHAGEAQGPGSALFSEAANHGQSDPFRTAGNFQNGAEHRTQADQQGDALQGFAHTLVDGVDNHGNGHSGKQTNA